MAFSMTMKSFLFLLPLLVLTAQAQTTQAQTTYAQTPQTARTVPASQTVRDDPQPPEQTFYVAPDGNDANFGTKEKPFASVAKARDAIRLFRQANPNTDKLLIVVLRGGTYFFEEPLRLTAVDSGTEQSPTIYEAYKDEPVIFSGGRTITHFLETAPGRWEAIIPEVAEGTWFFSQLYVNNRRCLRPVLPVDSYYTIAEAVPPETEGGKPDTFRFREGEFDPRWKNPEDIEINTFHRWTMDHLRLKAVDTDMKIVSFTGPTHSAEQAPLDPSTRYRIENVYEALVSPGQWYLDRQTGRLTILAKPGFDMNKAVVVAPKATRLLSIEGEPETGNHVGNIAFKGITFAHTAWTTPPQGAGFPQADVDLDGAITLTGVNNCAFADCVVRHTGAYGIDIGAGCSAVAVVRCELFDLGAGGIKIGPTRLGREPDEKKWCSGISVADCRISHGGRIHAEGVGVWVGHANHCQIEQNDIYDFYYSGVSVGWKWGPGFSPAHHNRIARNHIFLLGQGVLDDLAGIYTLGESPGTVLEGNRIHDVRRDRYGGWGLYFDESSRGILAEKNLVYRTQDGGFHQHYGLENTVRNNIFSDAENGLLAISNLEKSGVLTFERNIFHLFGVQNLWEKDQLREDTTFRSNLYWRHGGGEVRFFGGRDFEQWKNEKEPDAVLADPMFRDPANGDYSLLTGTPAIEKINFIPLDMHRPGRMTKTDKTAALPVPSVVFPPTR